MGLYGTFDGKRLDFMQFARQNLKIISCVLSRLQNCRLIINLKKLVSAELIFLLTKFPKIITILAL